MSQPCPGPGTKARRGRLAALAGLLALISTAAQAQSPCPARPNWSSNPQMRFTTQQVDGRPVLLAEGVIDEDMLPRLGEALAGFEGREVWLRSPGGSARAGDMAGRLIRDRNLATRVPSGWACAGACAFMFLGGVPRTVAPGGALMVQMFTHTGENGIVEEVARGGAQAERVLNEVRENSIMWATEETDYLIRMGVSRSLLSDIVYQTRAFDSAGNPAPPRCLSAEEMRRYNVVTAGEPPSG